MKKKREREVLQGIQQENGSKDRNEAKNTDGMAITVSTKENAIKKAIGKKFAIPLNFDFFKNLVYSYGPREDLIVRLELNSSEMVILCSRDNTTKYNLRDISIEHDTIFDLTTSYLLYTETAS